MTEKELRNKVVNTFAEWLGYNEVNRKYRAIIDLYNTQKTLPRGYKVQYTDEWCATAVSAIGVKLGLEDIILPECSCSAMIALYKKQGCWQEADGYVPQIGDLIMYSWKDNGVGDCTLAPNHVGMVEAVNGTSLTIIEGNKGGAVSYRAISVNARYIRGYCLPNYAIKAIEEKPEDSKITVRLPILQKGAKNDVVKTLQTLLIGHGYSCGSNLVDGSFGPATLSAVKKYQSNNSLTVDGSVGKATWSSLLKI